MKPQTKQLEVKLIRERNKIERKGIRLIKSALIEQYKDFIQKANNLTPNQWKDIQLTEKPIRSFYNEFYPMSGNIGVMTRNHLLPKKDAESEFYLSMFQQKLRDVIDTTDYAERIRSITGTTKERINSVLSDVLMQGETEGWGIEKIRKELVKQLGSQIKGNVIARARGIAQTEMISASNQASVYAADSTGLEYRKFWSTSHLPNIRASHIMAEQDSIERGGLKKDELFINGLRYPGDPRGSSQEVCNCRCSLLTEIV